MQKTDLTPTNYELRVFALILVIGFLVLGVVMPFLMGQNFNPVFPLIAGFVSIIGLVAPKSLTRPRIYWIKIGNVLGRINSTILFTVIYLVLFSTFGFIFKLLKRDRMNSKFGKISSTMVMKKEISAFDDPF